jgi:hypothetical protein
MWRALLAVAVLTSPAVAKPSLLKAPVARIADPASLKDIIHFGEPDPALPMNRSGEVWWRADVDLPPGVSLRGVEVMGYDPIFLRLSDGRCFKIELDGNVNKLTRAAVAQSECQPERKIDSPWPAALPRSGMHYVGRAWDLDAWTDPRTGKTIVVEAKHQDAPLLTADMRVIAVGAMGAPDAPMTEVTFVGYIGRQLTIATAMLYYAG